MNGPSVVPGRRSIGPGWPTARVVVGVDGSAANWGAVRWAAQEARRVGCLLVLVGAGPGDTPPSAPPTGSLEREYLQHLTRDMLEDVRGRLAEEQDVDVRVGVGAASQALVRAAGEQDLLVVGKRGGHPVARTVLGSTSIAVAGHSDGPVVVVPEGWAAGEGRAGPIVAGVDGDRDPVVLAYAFSRADELGVSLVVVGCWSLPATYTRSADEIAHLDRQAHEQIETVLRPWRRRHPRVPLRTEAPLLTPAVALSSAASDPQLVVLGRHTGPGHSGGLRLGSTTRRVLHHATCPVAVVPPPVARPDDAPEPFDDTDAPQF